MYSGQFIQLPPSVLGNVLAFAGSLSGLLIIAGAATAMMLTQIHRLLDDEGGWATPLTAARISQFLLYLSFVLLVLPDVLLLMTWNEISGRIVDGMAYTDRVLDGLAAIPLLVSIVLFLRNEPGMTVMLSRPPGQRHYTPWRQMWSHFAIIGLAIATSVGVAAGKMALEYPAEPFEGE